MSEQQFVEGWASSAHCPPGKINTDAVVIAPEATSDGLVSWAIGQMQQLNVLLNVIGTARHGDVAHDPGEICGAIRHQLEQIESVLMSAADAIHDERKKAARS